MSSRVIEALVGAGLHFLLPYLTRLHIGWQIFLRILLKNTNESYPVIKCMLDL